MAKSSEQTERIRAELYLRQHASSEIVQQLRKTVTRMRRLETDGIADMKIKTWATVNPALEELSVPVHRFHLRSNRFRHRLIARDTRFVRYLRRETTSLISSRPAVGIQVPIVCLVVYEDDELRCVAPCSDGDQMYSVEKCLAALEAGLTDPFAFQEHIEPIVEDSMEKTDKNGSVETLCD